MGVPFLIALEAWLPFPIVGIIAVILAALYIFYFQNEFRLLASLVCIISVVLSMLAVVLIPVDVFLVSSTRLNGTKEVWADNETVIRVEHIVLQGYYVVYGMVLGFVFIVLPFTYFYHNFNNEDETFTKQKCILRALKFTFASTVLLAIVLVIGVVAPMGKRPFSNSTVYKQLNYLKDYDCFTNALENGFVFAINCLGLIGMICAIIYTSCGMSILPINLIKGKPKDDTQQLHMEYSINELLEKIQNLSNQSADEQPLGEVERKELHRFSRQLSELQSRSDTIRQQSYSPLKHCRFITRLFEIILGITLMLLSLFIVTALIMSNVNRLLSSYGMYAGYMPNDSSVSNPIDVMLLLSHKVFPLDYVLLCILLFYFTLSSVAGMQHIGIWCLWIQGAGMIKPYSASLLYGVACFVFRIYKGKIVSVANAFVPNAQTYQNELHCLRRGRTTVQALVFSSFVLAVVTIYSGVFIHTIAPQYVTYGTQSYLNISSVQLSHANLMPCSLHAPAEYCLMTRLMTLQTRLFYRMWFFGVAFFWCSWLFVLIFVISCVASIVRSRKTIAQIMMRNNREIEESQQNLLEL